MAEAYHIDPQVLLDKYTRPQVDLMLFTNNWRCSTAESGADAPRTKSTNKPGDNAGAAKALMAIGAL